MTITRKPLVVGNWKMNGGLPELSEIKTIAENAGRFADAASMMICPPFPLISQAVKATQQSPLDIGAQDCHPNPKGAHTGDVAAEMLVELGVKAILVGHSERRADHGETNQKVAAKAAAARRAGALALVCVGETADERDAGRALAVVEEQLAQSLNQALNQPPAQTGGPGISATNTVIAYEPVWAIGTGRTPTLDEVAAVHHGIRRQLTQLLGAETGAKMRLLYGGSVKPANARDLMTVSDVDGALVGGASLKAADFLAIVGVYD